MGKIETQQTKEAKARHEEKLKEVYSNQGLQVRRLATDTRLPSSENLLSEFQSLANLVSRVNQGDSTTEITYQCPLPPSTNSIQFVRLHVSER